MAPILSVGVDIWTPTVLGVPSWKLSGSSLDLYFSTGSYFGVTGVPSSFLTTSRASTGYVNDQSGNWTSVASNLPRISNLGLLVEEARTNSIRNNSMQGAMVGADGVELLTNGNFASAGTGWTVGQSGGGSVVFATGHVTITGDGSDYNNYVSQQISGLVIGRSYVISIAGPIFFGAASVGTTSGATNVIGLTGISANGNASAITDRLAFTATATSLWVNLGVLTAAPTQINSISVQDGERVENGGFTSNPISASQSTVQNGWQWSNNTGTGTVVYNGTDTVTITAGTGFQVGMSVAIPTLVGAAYTITADIGTSSVSNVTVGNGAQGAALLNAVGNVGSAQKFQFTATATTTYVSFVKGPGATVSTIKNVSVQSAGALPTNWYVPPSTVAPGLLTYVTGVGTYNGVDTIDLRFAGTTTSGAAFQVNADTGSGATATNAQAWALSAFMALAPSSATNFTNISTIKWEMDEYNVGSYLTSEVSADFKSSITSSLTRQSAVLTTTNASVNNVRHVASITPTGSGVAVDFTLRIGWPQLELGASVTSPIRTTAAAATRAADVVTLTSPPSFGSSFTLFAKGTPQTPAAYAATRPILSADDGTLTNRNQLFMPGGVGGLQSIMSNASGSLTLGTRTITSNVSHKVAATFQATDMATAVDGQTAEENAATALTAPIASQVGLGKRADGGTFWNGFIERIAIWPSTRITNATLQAITT